MHWTRCVLWLLGFALGLPPALAASSSRSGTTSSLPAEARCAALPPPLDPVLRGLQHGVFEWHPYGGGYLGRTVGQTWQAGLGAYWHLDATWALGANYGYGRALPDRTSTFGRVMQRADLHLADAEVMISNDAALRWGRSLVPFDFYLSLGVGGIQIDRQWEPVGLIGGGVKFYTSLRWLAVRIDLNNLLHHTPHPGGDRFDIDAAIVGGLALLHPRRVRHTSSLSPSAREALSSH